MSLEFGVTPCGLDCPYCYQHGTSMWPASFRERREPLSVEEVLDAVDQALDLGLGGVGIIGPYEPIREKGILTLIRGIHARKLRITLFTKGTYISNALAEELCQYDVAMGITVNSLHCAVHDELTGREGSHKLMMEGLNLLLRNGYDRKRHKIIVQSVIVRQNMRDLPEVWRWAKRSSFVPFFERITIYGRARENISRLNPSPEMLFTLFSQISEIDQREFGNRWIPHPPWVGEACDRHLNSCHLTVDGYIQPCTGVDIPVGNIRDTDLATILRGSTVIQALRNIQDTIGGSCRECHLHDACYGCRGQAYQLTGDYLASDPCCWNNSERCNQLCDLIDECSLEDEGMKNVLMSRVASDRGLMGSQTE